MVPIATGSDTGGSLRNPAAFCGIAGFRPSPGVVPSEMRGHGWMPLGSNGPMARTVPDLAMLLSAMVSDDARDPYAYFTDPASLHPLPPVDLSSLRVAVSPDLGFAPVERIVVDAFQSKTALFRHLFACAEDTTPDCTGADEAFAVLRAVAFLGIHLDKVRTRPADVGPNIHANVEEGLRYSAADVARALTLQTTMQRRWHSFFTKFDVLLAPAISVSPRPWSELYPAEIDGRKLDSYYHWLALAYAGTLAGHPCLSLPVGLDSAGMPFGLQLIGRRNGDAALLAGCRGVGGGAGAGQADRATGAGFRTVDGGTADQRDAGVHGVRLRARPFTKERPCAIRFRLVARATFWLATPRVGAIDTAPVKGKANSRLHGPTTIS